MRKYRALVLCRLNRLIFEFDNKVGLVIRKIFCHGCCSCGACLDAVSTSWRFQPNDRYVAKNYMYTWILHFSSDPYKSSSLLRTCIRKCMFCVGWQMLQSWFWISEFYIHVRSFQVIPNEHPIWINGKSSLPETRPSHFYRFTSDIRVATDD